METVMSRVARWMVVFALLLAYWPFGQPHAHAAIQEDAAATAKKAALAATGVARTPAQKASWRAPAVLHFDKTIYVARFDWHGARYRFEVGTRKIPRSDLDHSRFLALISKNGEPMAACERKVSGELPFDTNSMLLRCEGPMFSPAATMAKFVFGPSLDEPSLTIWPGPRAAGQSLALVTLTDKVNVAKAE